MTAHVTEPSILLVDDSNLVLKFGKAVLKDLGLPIHTAENGRKAWEFMRDAPANLLITDLMMPELDGFGLIARLREERRFEQTYIIVMTALNQVSDKVRALELGANDYTIKPLDSSELRARVRNGLREIRLKMALNEALSRLDRELNLVGRLQRRLLPKTLPQGAAFESAVSYIPWSQAGGDYYDCFLDGHGRWVVTVADVSGHGASAAVLMAMVRALLKVLVNQGRTAAEVVDSLNRALMDNIGDTSDFVTLFLGLMDRDCRRLNYCSAGHGDMLLIGPAPGVVSRLAYGGTILGCFPSTWEDHYVDITTDQTLFLYTDGLIEAANDQGEEFGRERLLALLGRVDPTNGPAAILEATRVAVDDFVGATPFEDDLTMFLLKIH